MSVAKQITDFPTLSVEDTVSLTLGTAAAPGLIDFVLESAPNITWWKGVELYSARDTLINRVQTQDASHGPQTFTVIANDLVGARLVLAKAKIFGIHTGMYEIHNLSAFAGRRLHFLWQRDDHQAGPVAGFFRDLGNAINSVVEAAADVVETVVEAVAEVVSSVLEAVGNVVANVVDAIGNVLGEIPGLGPLLKGALHWAGTVVSTFFDLVGSVVKGVLDVVSGVVGGLIRVVGGAVGGLLAWDGGLVVKGVGDIVAGIVGPVIAVVGKAVAFVQAVLFMQMGERALTPAETAMLRRVFRGSVLLHNVRVVDGFAGLFSTNSRPFTLGNTIYMKGTSAGGYPSTLVHECAHVWQNQHTGFRYIADALWAQATIADHYSWRAEIAAGRFLWRDFNAEAQAAFLQDVFVSGKRIPATGVQGEFYDDDPLGTNLRFVLGGEDHTALAQASVPYVRGVWRFVPRH